MAIALLSESHPVVKRESSARPTATDGAVLALPAGTFVVAALGCVLPSATENPVTWTDPKSNVWAGEDTASNASQASLAWSKLATALAVGDAITGTLTTARSNRMVGALAFTGVDGLDGTPVAASGTSGSGPTATIPRTANGCWVVVAITCNATTGPVVWPSGWTHPAGYAISTSSGSSDRRLELGWKFFDTAGSDDFAADLTSETGPWALTAIVLKPTVATVTYYPTSDKGSSGVTRVPAGATASFSLLDDPTDVDHTDHVTIQVGGYLRLGFDANEPGDHSGTAWEFWGDNGGGTDVVKYTLRAYQGDSTTTIATSNTVTLTSTWTKYTFVLTPTQSAAIGTGTAWDDVQLRLEVSS